MLRGIHSRQEIDATSDLLARTGVTNLGLPSGGDNSDALGDRKLTENREDSYLRNPVIAWLWIVSATTA